MARPRARETHEPDQYSLQAEFEKRFSHGLVYQGNYAWSKALGESEGASQFYDTAYRNAQNRSSDKRLMTFNRGQVFKSNGIWELPAGRDKQFLKNANRLVDGVLGGWRLSGILTFTTGRPLTVTAPIATFNKYTTGQTPDVSGALSKAAGQLTFDGNGPCYFCNFTQISDPHLANIAPALAAQSNLLAQTFFTGPRFFNLDASLAKTFRISERFNMQIRTDWLNATNHEDFSQATIDLSINSPTFGRVTGPSASSNNNRIIVLGARLNF